jgi:allophanate hydrolase subunit 2
VVAGAAGRGVLSTDADRAPIAWPSLEDDPIAGPHRSDPIRLIAGPAAADSPAALEALVAAAWRVGSGSDRIGLRLEGPIRLQPAGGQVVSHGVVTGAIQLPPDGGPIVLLADAQTTGGYPIPAVAISADLPRLGQLRPGAPVSFELVPLDDARAALIRQRAAFAAGALALREAGGWDDLWQSAGG